MKINRIDHISVAVNSLEQAQKLWEPLLGKSGPDDSYTDEGEKIKVARYFVGEACFELMESTHPDGEVARFLSKHGEGIMLLSLNVDSVRTAQKELHGMNYPFIGEPKPFRRGEYTFIHPGAINGVLVELIDDKS